jgi:hypothetical protein
VGVLQRFERRLGGMVEGLFARAFKSEVQPVEVAAALQRELDGEAAIVGRDRTLVPNHFVVELGDHDYERLAPYERPLTNELEAMVREHAAEQRYTFVGPVEVELERQPNLETGVFRVHSDVVAGPEAEAPEPPQRPATPAAAPAPGPVAGPPGVHAGERRDPGATTAMPIATEARPTTYGRLMVREGKNASYEVELRHAVTVIGRGTDADIRLTDQAVSRRHAEIRVANGAVMLNDLQSTNGTTVNGASITTTALADGDEVRVGETVLIFHAPPRG